MTRALGRRGARGGDRGQPGAGRERRQAAAEPALPKPALGARETSEAARDAVALKPVLVVSASVASVGTRALEDGPSPGGTQTNVRTLEPQPLPPAARTVTVTVTTTG